MKSLSILGSTGSIGVQTLDVVRQHPDQFEIVALSAGTNGDLLIKQAIEFQPKLISVGNQTLAEKIRMELPSEIKILYGKEGLVEVAIHPACNFVVSSIVGSAGLVPTLAAIEAGKSVGLANKETLVTAGHLVMEKAKEKKVSIIPIDSEHSAIFQCLNGEDSRQVKRIIITASGGSFRDMTREQLKDVTPQQALNHPNWSMGAKITIDSATMMNKGLEVMEAHWLFQLPYEQIDTILHRESIIHSMVEFEDRAILAQLGTPDMKIPIQYALTYPGRMTLETEPLDLLKTGTLHFEPLSKERYPCLAFAYEAGEKGGTMPAVLNGANEIAVARFLKGEISFLEIEDVISSVMNQHQVQSYPDLETIMEVDQWARQIAGEW